MLQRTGLKTNARAEFSIESVLFRDENRGKSLIEIGSRIGDFCFQCKAFGFGVVKGIDADPERIRLASLRPEASNGEVSFCCGQFEQMELKADSFDFVVCKGVLHHMFDPFTALNKMMSIARRAILIEFEDLDAGSSPLQRLNRYVSSKNPVVALGKTRSSNTVADRSFLFNEAAFGEIFNRRSACFDRIESSRSHVKERKIICAKKRHITNLHVVAGPSSSGKSTLIESLVDGQHTLKNLPEFKGDERVFDAGKLHKLNIGALEEGIFHYDITRSVSNSMRTIERDPTARILDVCDKVNIVTLLPSPERLQHQFENNSGDSHSHSARKEILYQIYFNNHDQFKSIYEQWYLFLESYNDKIDKNIIVVIGGKDNYIEYDSNDFSSIFKKYYNR